VTWTTFHEPLTVACAHCGKTRPTVEMARVWRRPGESRDYDDELYRLLCHGPHDTRPTCYERVLGL